MISDILTETEKKLARELSEADPSFRLKMACNLIKSSHDNWPVIVEADPGLAEQVRQELAANEENLVPQNKKTVYVTLKNVPNMK